MPVTYIGETTRQISKRVEEHLKSHIYNKQSHIYKHLQENENCFDNSNSDCFSILDTAPTTWQLKLKEGLYIGWENPSLNKQVKYVACGLTLKKKILFFHVCLYVPNQPCFDYSFYSFIYL